MNIFALDRDPRLAAQYHLDKHLVKMPLEYAQMLCTNLFLTADGYATLPAGLYKPTHMNHPCTVWARQTLGNHLWLSLLALEVGRVYHDVYGKWHKSTLLTMELPPPSQNIPDRPLTEFVQAMPEGYHDLDSIVAYRNYYRHGKAEIATYRNRPVPEFMR